MIIDSLVISSITGLKNTGILYIVLRLLRLTSRTGRIDPWHEVFASHRKKWVLARFKDGTILVGWPRYYSEDGERKELFLAEAAWSRLNDDGTYREEAVDGDGVFVCNFDEIIAIEPDAVLIYAGHNEYYGALGTASTESLGGSTILVRLYLGLRQYRT